MKYFIIITLMTLSTVAKADFWSGMFLGSLLTSSSSNEVVVESEFSKQIDVIKNKIREDIHAHNKVTTIAVNPDKIQDYYSFLKNSNYIVSIKNNNTLEINNEASITMMESDRKRRALRQKETEAWFHKHRWKFYIGFFFCIIGFVMNALIDKSHPLHHPYNKILKMTSKKASKHSKQVLSLYDSKKDK